MGKVVQEMRLEKVVETLNDLARGVDIDGISTNLILKDGIATLRVASSASDREAVVSTPGDRWFSLEVKAGFSSDVFEEGLTDGEIADLLADYWEFALSYVINAGVRQRKSRFGFERLEIQRPDGEALTLRKPFGRSLSRFGRRRPLNS